MPMPRSPFAFLGSTLQSLTMWIQDADSPPSVVSAPASLGPGSRGWGLGGEAWPSELYQGPLQEEYGCDALVLVGGQPAVPAAAAEPALGLRVQVELGAHGAVFPALLLLGRAGVVL